MLTRREVVIDKPFRDQRYRNHRRKVHSALPRIDVGPPREFPHLTLKLRKLRLEEERQGKICADNINLVHRLSIIMRTKGLDNINMAPRGPFEPRRKEKSLLPKRTREAVCACASPYIESPHHGNGGLSLLRQVTMEAVKRAPPPPRRRVVRHRAPAGYCLVPRVGPPPDSQPLSHARRLQSPICNPPPLLSPPSPTQTSPLDASPRPLGIPPMCSRCNNEFASAVGGCPCACTPRQSFSQQLETLKENGTVNDLSVLDADTEEADKNSDDDVSNRNETDGDSEAQMKEANEVDEDSEGHKSETSETDRNSKERKSETNETDEDSEGIVEEEDVSEKEEEKSPAQSQTSSFSKQDSEVTTSSAHGGSTSSTSTDESDNNESEEQDKDEDGEKEDEEEDSLASFHQEAENDNNESDVHVSSVLLDTNPEIKVDEASDDTDEFYK